jgi:hypothetical protein
LKWPSRGAYIGGRGGLMRRVVVFTTIVVLGFILLSAVAVS